MSRYLISESLHAEPRRSLREYIFRENRLEGVLVRNGLPPATVYLFEKCDLPLTQPHYLLTSSAEGGRESYYIAITLGIVVASLFLAAAVMQTWIIANSKSAMANPPSVQR